MAEDGMAVSFSVQRREDDAMADSVVSRLGCYTYHLRHELIPFSQGATWAGRHSQSGPLALAGPGQSVYGRLNPTKPRKTDRRETLVATRAT